MKKIVLTAAVMMFAGSAFATTTFNVTQVLRINNGPIVEPCPTSPDAPVPANGYCYDGRECPVGYDRIGNYDGSGSVGFVCQENGMYTGGN